MGDAEFGWGGVGGCGLQSHNRVELFGGRVGVMTI